MYENHDLYDHDGFCKDGSGIQIKDIEEEGGSYQTYYEFRNLVIDSAKSSSPLKTNVNKNKAPKLSDEIVAPKLSRQERLGLKEKEELSDPQGLEQSLKKSYVGLANIPISNLSIHKTLSSTVMFQRVLKIADSIMDKYDPSQVCM